ncbi:MAG: DUF1573 domain-containing protein [Victivallales bacterium]|nr:DUF1573 domain-containing protein [Victivallales bacterium]
MRRFIIYWFAIACTVAFLSCKKDEAPKQPEQTAVEQVAPKAEEQPAAAVAKETVKVEVESAQAHDHPHLHDAEEEDDDEEEVDEEKLKDNPLKLVGMEKMVVEDVTEITEKLLEFEVVNSSQEDVFFKRVRSSCSCLTITESPDPQVVKPGEKIVIKSMLHGSSFTQSGTYPRALFVECRGCREMTIPITVKATCLVEVEPSAKIDLGTFEGYDVNWVRQVTINIRDLDKMPNVELKLPKENPHFNFNLVKEEGKNAFRFEIRPKLPMKRGRIQDIIFIPVIGIGENNGVRLFVRGEVTGLNIDLSSSRVWVKEADLLEKKSAEVTFLVERSLKADQKVDKIGQFMGGMRSRLPSYRHQHAKAVEQGADLIREEEEAVHDQGVKETWEKISKDFKLMVPEWIQVTQEVQDKGVAFKLVVSDEILNQPNRRMILTLMSNDKPFRRVELRVMAKQ